MSVTPTSLAIGGTGGLSALIIRSVWNLVTTPIVTPVQNSEPIDFGDPVTCRVRLTDLRIPLLGQTVIIEERWGFFLVGLLSGVILVPLLEIGAVLRRRWLQWLQRGLLGAPLHEPVAPFALRGRY